LNKHLSFKTMKEKKVIRTLFYLLLNNKNGSYNDSYSLFRVLSRWFDLIDTTKEKREMVEEGYVVEVENGQNPLYLFSELGNDLLKNNFVDSVEELKNSFPGQVDKIDYLVSNLKYS
jgi:hypothetical protein